MYCPVCDTENQKRSKNCSLCDFEFVSSESVTNTTKSTKRDFLYIWSKAKWPMFIFFGLALCSAFVHISENFLLPSDVKASSISFEKVKKNYESEKDVWKSRKNQIIRTMRIYNADGGVNDDFLAFEGIPLEVFLAYLDDDMDFFTDKSTSCFIYPKVINKHKSEVFLCKKTHFLGIFPITYSVEITVFSEEGGQVNVAFGEFRRGRRLLNFEEVNTVFFKELSKLKTFNEFARQITNVTWLKSGSRLPQKFFQGDPDDVTLSWEFKENTLLYLR